MPRLALALVLVVLALPSAALAQNAKLAHSGYLLAGNDAPLEATVSMTFALYSAPTLGSATWSATTGVTVRAGYYAVLLGDEASGFPVLPVGELATDRWLEVSVGSTTLAPRIILNRAPTAIHAADADALGGIPAAQYARSSALAAHPLLDGSRAFTGAVTLAGAPTADLQAATKLYVDQTAASAVTSGLTNLDASRLATGVVPDGRIAGAYAGALQLSNPANTYKGGLDGTFSGTSVGTHTGTFQGAVQVEEATGRTSCTTRGTVYFDTTQGVLLVCNGSAYERVGTKPATLEWSVGQLDFGTVTAAAARRTATVKNAGEAGVAITFAAGPGFTVVSNTCGASVAANATCDVVFELTPGDNTATRTTLAAATATGLPSAQLILTGRWAPLASCKAIKIATGTTTDTTYWIDPDGTGSLPSMDVYCDMNTYLGGWTRCLAWKYQLDRKPPLFNGKDWITGLWRTGASWSFGRDDSMTDYGSFCSTLVDNGGAQVFGEAVYPSGFGTNIRTEGMAIPAGLFKPGNRLAASGASSHTVKIDSRGTGFYGVGCSADWGSDTRGIQSLCLSDSIRYQTQYPGWSSMAYASCPDANSQPCTCTQSVACGGTDLREQHIALVLYVK